MAAKKTQKPKRVTNTKKTENAIPPAGGGMVPSLFPAFSAGGNMGTGVQLSQVTTIQRNLRYYLISNFRQMLCEMYVEWGLCQTVIDVPVDDAFRGGVNIKTQQLSEDQIIELDAHMEAEDDIGTCAQANKWRRLFGGSAVLIITEQDPKTPLDVDALHNAKMDFRAVDMWELYWTRQNTEDYSAEYQGQAPYDQEFYNYYGQQVHHTRVLKMVGKVAPSFIRPRLRGWGFSEMESVVRSLNQYLKSTDLAFEVLDEFKIDIYKIKNLANTLLSCNGREKVYSRIQDANLQKNYQNAIAMDSEDDYDNKELTFSGLAEVMQQIRLQVASDLRMPLTKVFGISAAGFSSGEDDIENYNSMIESSIRQKSKFHLMKMIKLRCQQLFGFIPDDMSIYFNPLRVLSAEQEENVKTQQFNRLIQSKTAGEITTKEFREGCNKEDLLLVQLDTDIEALTDLTQELEMQKEAEAESSQAGDEENSEEKSPAPKKAPASTLKAPEAKQ